MLCVHFYWKNISVFTILEEISKLRENSKNTRTRIFLSPLRPLFPIVLGHLRSKRRRVSMYFKWESGVATKKWKKLNRRTKRNSSIVLEMRTRRCSASSSSGVNQNNNDPLKKVSLLGGGVSWIWNVEFGIVNRGIYRGMAQKTGRFSTFYSPDRWIVE